MPNEQIGTCGHAQWPDQDAIQFELEFGIACLRRHCGLEPPGSLLDVAWHEHDLGGYATISLVWGAPACCSTRTGSISSDAVRPWLSSTSVWTGRRFTRSAR